MSKPAPFGRTRHGHSTLPWALGTGIACAAVVATLTASFNGGNIALAVVEACATVMPCSALGWVLVVDRSTLPGATRNPEHSVESNWYNRAVNGAFHDMIILAGIALALLSMIPALDQWSGSTVLLVILVVITCDVAMRYWFTARREG